MPQAQNISQQTGFPEWIDFDFLRKKGLEHIGSLSGDWWTDHNTHDPGITILEVLCYALTDLGYRTQFDAKNIFARPYNELDVDSNFFTADEILTCNPLTLQDYKKMLLDIKGVRNAWLIPVVDCNDFQGLYNVFIDIDDFIESGNVNKISLNAQLILNEVKQVLYAHRGLGEDFKDIKIVEQEKLKICLNLDLTATAIPEEIIGEAYLKLQNFLTPYITFYTLQELLEKGKKIEEIFAGRPSKLLSHGFIDNDDLAKLEPKNKLHISDLYKILMEIGGIRAVTQLTVNNESWCLNLSNNKSPSIDIDCFTVNITKGNQLPIQNNNIDWINIKQKIRNRLSNYNKILRNKYELGQALAVEENLDLADYTSIMEEFPVAYGVGSGHTPLSDENIAMKHHAFQMKGYLAFYDQLLVNYLGQLANLRTFFKLYDTDGSEKVKQSYSVQSLVDKMPMIEDILKNANNVDPLSLQLPVLKLETPVSTRSERDRIMELFRNGFNEDRLEFLIMDACEKNPKVEECFRFYITVGIKGTDYKMITFNTLAEINPDHGGLGIYKSTEVALKEIEKLKFYGIFEQAYIPIDNNYDPDVEATYSFTINEKSLSYEDFLSHINESQNKTFQRREDVLDHLLARFSEQFTEYSLLMFALNGKKRDEMEMIKDKERFLKNYPETSRNRGKAFDYSDKNNLWNTVNTSGFEKRVAGYMGIDEWKRRNLNLFKVVKSSVSYHQQWMDEFNNVLLRTPYFYDKELLEQCVQKILTKGIIEDIDCYMEGYYTFIVKDDCGNVLAKHPQRYDSEERRNAMKSYFYQKIIQENLPTKTEISYTYNYKLYNEKGELLLSNTDEFKSEHAAKSAFYQLLAYAIFEKNYEIKRKAKRYYFVVKDSQGKEIAVSEKYITADERDIYKNNTIKYLKKYWLPFQINQLPKSCTWQMQNIQGKPFVKGAYHFEDCNSSASAYAEAMNLARNAQNWGVVEVDKKWYLGLWRMDEKSKLFLDWMPKERMLLALSVQEYLSIDAAEVGLNTLRQEVVNNSAFLPIIFKKNTKEYGYQWYVPQLGRSVMQSKQLLNTEQKAIRAYDYSLKLLSVASNYNVVKGTDDLYRLEIADYINDIWLVSVDEFTKESDALSAVTNYVEMANENIPDRDILTQIEGKYIVRIIDTDSEETIIESHQLFEDMEDAYRMTVTMSDLISDKNNFKYTEEILSNGTSIFGFELMDKDQDLIAKHPQQYDKKEKLEDALACLQAFETGITPTIIPSKHEKIIYLTHDCHLHLIDNESSVNQHIKADIYETSVPQQEELLYECPDKGDRLRMLDTNELNAIYSKQFLSENELILEKNAFISYWKSADKIFPEVVNTQSVMSYGKDLSQGPVDFCAPPKNSKSANYHAFQFCLKHKSSQDFTCAKDVIETVGKIALRTINVFDTSEEAMTYGNKNLIHFISLLKDYDTYNVLKCPNKSRCYFLQVFDYKNEKEYPELVSEQAFETEKCARLAMKYLVEWAGRFPVISFDVDDKMEFKYQILLDGNELSKLRNDKDLSDRFWTSNDTYDTWDKAYVGFLECLRLLNYTPNIFHLNEPFGLAIGEILLETNKMKNEIWSELSLRMKALDKEKHLHIIPADDCTCEIVLASDCYMLGFHPYEYDNPIQRTRALQQWYSALHCGEFSKPKVLVTNAVSKKNQIPDIHKIDINKNTVIQYSTKFSIFQILKYAEFPEFYEIETYKYKDNNSDKTIFRMTLCDEDHQQIAVFIKDNDDCFVTYDECLILQKEFILMAREHPIKLGADGKYFFRIYDRYWKPIIGAKPSVWDLPDSAVKDKKQTNCNDTSELITIDGRYVWQSTMRCFDIIVIEKRLEQFWKNIENTLNYNFVKENPCGPFSMQVVDTDEIWAYYPQRIESNQKAIEIADKIWANINREGFHVIEHILLRDDKKRNVCCDKISGVVTIVIPHWSQRFQNEQFRSFFQATIGRELPAHLAPHICWVTPEGMMKFEKVYYKWLFDDEKKDNSELMEVVETLQGYFPLSTFDTKDANNILLDQSSLN